MGYSARKEALIEKLLNDQCSKAELKELYSLIKRYGTPEELDALLHKGWTSLKPSVKLDSKSSEEILISINKNIAKQRHLNIWAISRIAASILLIIGITYSLPSLRNYFSDQSQVATLTTTTRSGAMDKVTLEDGSVIWLNAGSTLEYPEKFGSTTRTVSLTGEAFFEVAKEKNRPFIINTGSIHTTVMGTSFNVRAFKEENNITVTVATGKVRVESSTSQSSGNMKSGDLVLTPNMQTRYDLQDKVFVTSSVVSGDFTDWRDGVVRLDGTLEEAVKILERTYNKKIVLENKNLRFCNLKANYQKESLENILNSIHYILDTNFTQLGDTIVLTGKGCN